jgi:hypothetical protein
VNVDDSDDERLIAEHQARVEHLLLPMVIRYEFDEMANTPEGKALLDAAPPLRASLAIAALAGPPSGRTAAHLASVPEMRARVRAAIARSPRQMSPFA